MNSTNNLEKTECSCKDHIHSKEQFDVRRSSFKKSKSVDASIARSTNDFNPPIANADGVEISNEVCSFGLAKNLEKQICIIPSRKKSECTLLFLSFVAIHGWATAWSREQLKFHLNHIEHEHGLALKQMRLDRLE